MKFVILVSAILVAVSTVGCAVDHDRVLFRQHAGYGSNYCHEKILTTRDPLTNSRDVVDYYGACGEGP